MFNEFFFRRLALLSTSISLPMSFNLMVFFFFVYSFVAARWWYDENVVVRSCNKYAWSRFDQTTLQVYPIGSEYQWILKFFMASVSLHHVYLLQSICTIDVPPLCPVSFGLIKYVLKLKTKKKTYTQRERENEIAYKIEYCWECSVEFAPLAHATQKIVVFIIKRLHRPNITIYGALSLRRCWSSVSLG